MCPMILDCSVSFNRWYVGLCFVGLFVYLGSEDWRFFWADGVRVKWWNEVRLRLSSSCGGDAVTIVFLLTTWNGRFNGSMIHHPRSTFNEVSSCKAVEIQVLKGLHSSSRNHPIVYRSTLMSQFPSSTKTIRRLLPIQWPQPQSEEICLAMEEAEFEEKVYLLFSVFFHWSFRISLECNLPKSNI